MELTGQLTLILDRQQQLSDGSWAVSGLTNVAQDPLSAVLFPPGATGYRGERKRLCGSAMFSNRFSCPAK